MLRSRNEACAIHLAVDVAEHSVVSTLLERTTEQPRVRKIVERYATVAIEAHVHEVIILGNNGRRGAREVE